MHIITSEGEIVQGQELTSEEASILAEINNPDSYKPYGVYLSAAERSAVARLLIFNFNVTRRKRVEPFQPLPPSPGMEYVNALTAVLGESSTESEAS